LRTPLNSILLLSRYLSENSGKNLTEDQVESASVILNSGNGLLNLIDELLDLSKIEAGKMSLEYESVSIEDILKSMKALFTPVAREKKLDFVIKNSIDGLNKIETDRMRVEQILKNLLSNALKFTTQGEVTLAIKHAAKSGYIEMSVTDTGIGIAPEKLDLVFDAFQQADGSTKRKFGGTGLGLSISRQLARLLGGDISLQSEPSQGSVFTLVIPVSRSGASFTQEISFAKEALPELPAERKKLTIDDVPQINLEDDRATLVAGEPSILIVEDDIPFAKALMKFTHEKGYKCLTSSRGDYGLELAREYRPTAILLDIQLPVMDGWDVIEELKKDPATRHIPVHIMSSLHVKRESRMKGAVDFIDKPVAIEQMSLIFERLEDALHKSPKQVLIVEENAKHAKALAYFLETFNLSVNVSGSVNESIETLRNREVDCVIMDMGIPDRSSYDMLERIKDNPGLENLPIIIFTGKNLSTAEEVRIRQYADTIVVKTAHSYQRILDEVSLFLHVVEEKKSSAKAVRQNIAGKLHEILENKTVLVADDDVRNIFSLTKSLEKHKMQVLSAIDGKEALAQLGLNPQVDIVLMDMMMPEMDGYETTTKIRRDPRFKDLPVIAVTAKAMVGDREKCITAGASDYISKPVDIDQLISLLRVWLYDKKS
ncbi:MAG: response regulator, partial [Mucilaginibacter polytrichastri]|nr:response regulator [Mucilaginibacter polytrichastri]